MIDLQLQPSSIIVKNVQALYSSASIQMKLVWSFV